VPQRPPLQILLPGEEDPAAPGDIELTLPGETELTLPGEGVPARTPPRPQPSRRVEPRSDAPVSSRRPSRPPATPPPTRALLPGWTDDMRVGNGRIDRQHKTFYLRAVRIAIACEEGRGAEEIDEAVRYLREYAVEHFRDEEELMEAVGFPYLESHRESHLVFSAELATFEARLATTYDRAGLALELATWVADWFKQHVGAADRPLARFLEDSIG
jgi:hemerythrin-like metal-binding protein